MQIKPFSIKTCVNATRVKGRAGATMSYTTPLGWLNDDPENCIRACLELNRDSYPSDLLGLSPSIEIILKNVYNIKTVGELEDYIVYNGFPGAIHLKEETKFIISLRLARNLKFM